MIRGWGGSVVVSLPLEVRDGVVTADVVATNVSLI